MCFGLDLVTLSDQIFLHSGSSVTSKWNILDLNLDCVVLRWYLHLDHFALSVVVDVNLSNLEKVFYL